MLNSCDVSVVIPCFNAEDYLPDALTSIICQLTQPREIIVVDDGSTDRSAEVAEKFGARVIKNPSNMGIGYSRQRGAENAVGKYVGFLSADDVYHLGFLEEMSKHLDGNSIVFSDYYECNSLLKQQNIFKAPTYHSQQEFKKLVIEWALRKNMFTCFSTVLIPHWLFDRVKFHSELRHGEDLVFLLETVAHGVAWIHVPLPLVNYRVSRYRQNQVEWQRLWNAQVPVLMDLGVDSDEIADAIRRNYRVAFPLWKRVFS